jgi:hypothetical protein
MSDRSSRTVNAETGLHRPDRRPDLSLGALSLWIRGRQYDAREDFWDGNWLNVLVQIDAAYARVQAEGPIVRTDEIRSLVDGCRRLHETLRGEASLRCIEPNLKVSLAVNRNGHVLMVVDVTADNVTQAHHFEFELSYLPPFIRDAEDVLARFPIRGAPDPG